MHAAAVWDPEDTHGLKEVQPRFARWALNDHGRYGSVALMLEHLGWNTLKLRCTMTRVKTFFKITISMELLLGIELNSTQ